MNLLQFKIFLTVTIFCTVTHGISQLDNECDTPCIGGPSDICKKCSWACPDTCDNIGNPPPCHAPCKPNTCDCVEGTVRNLQTGQCVLPMSCPSKSITHFN